MDTWILFLFGAVGWAGFGGCLWMMKHKRHLEIRIFTVEPMPEVTNGEPFNELPRIMPTHGIIDHSGKWQPVQPVTQPQTVIEPEIPEEMHRLAEIAEPLIDQYDTVPQNGEWKRHQVYAAMLKNQKVKDIVGDDKWKVGFAIELGVAQRRMNTEEVAS